jgi:phosphatidylglycerol:prolipoprotein diacylglycerol transferase
MVEAFWDWWQHLPYQMSPTLLAIGGFQLRWYGLMYIVAFGVVYLLLRHRLRTEGLGYSTEQIQDYLFWVILGVMLGGRLGYVLFYDPGYFLAHPLQIFLPFEFRGGFRFTGIAGMSYHGGMIGALAASYGYCRRRGLAFGDFADFVAPAVPLGYTFGRIGNFINGELFGRPTDVPWGMYFPMDPTGQLRHPSQLYEAAGEGLLLFALLWSLRRPLAGRQALLAVYLMGYGLVRFVIEYFREPDAHLGFVWFTFSMGQVLCALMVLAGALLLALRRRPPA